MSEASPFRRGRILVVAACAVLGLAAALVVRPGILQGLFSTQFLPHLYCYLGNSRLVWLHVVSDSLIGLSYVAISATLVYLVRQARRAIPFSWMFLSFGVFIIACGLTHFMEVLVIWRPVYWLSGGVKVVTALASLVTAMILPFLVPKTLSLVDAAAVSRERQVQLASINQELEAFTYSVSHDLRAPLRHIDGFSKILLEEAASKLDGDALRHLTRIREGSQHMGRLVDDLLNLARIGRQELSRQVTGLNSVVESVVGELQADLQGRQIEFKIGQLPFVECDPGLMRQVFLNLLSNAVKYTRPRPRAVIEVDRLAVNGSQAIFVRDNGVGFSTKYADKLFGVFQRLHRQEDFEGTGVGLATVQRIIHKHGGRVWAEAELDKGATFYFTLDGAGHVTPVKTAAAGQAR